jgi:hypothetical protein
MSPIVYDPGARADPGSVRRTRRAALITVNRVDFDDDVPFRQAAGRGLAAFGCG